MSYEIYLPQTFHFVFFFLTFCSSFRIFASSKPNSDQAFGVLQKAPVEASKLFRMRGEAQVS